MSGRYDEEQDERVVADMSGVERRNIMFGSRPKGTRAELKEPPQKRRNSAYPYEEEEITPEQRKWYILGTLKASFMIGAVYVVGIGLVILLMILIWGH